MSDEDSIDEHNTSEIWRNVKGDIADMPVHITALGFPEETPPPGGPVVRRRLFRRIDCMVTHIARVWINRVRLPILHVVS